MIKDLISLKTPSACYNKAKNDGYYYLAGGTELTRLNSDEKATKLVSIRDLPYNTIEHTTAPIGHNDAHECIKIGSLCSFSQLLESDLIPAELKKALMFCSSLQKRNVATIGGNVAATRDDSYLVPTLAAFNAHVKIFKQARPVFILDFIASRKREELIEFLLLPFCKNPRLVSSYRISNTAASHALMTCSAGFCYSSEGKIIKPILATCVKNYGILRFEGIEKHIFESQTLDKEKIVQLIRGERSLARIKNDPLYGSAKFKIEELAASFYLIAEDLESKMKGGN